MSTTHPPITASMGAPTDGVLQPRKSTTSPPAVDGMSESGSATFAPEDVAREALTLTQPRLPELVERLVAFSDPTRLELLIAIHAAPGSPVKTLAAATGLSANTVSQALTTLRNAGLITNARDGRLSRWTLTDDASHELLHHLGAPHSDLHTMHETSPTPRRR